MQAKCGLIGYLVEFVGQFVFGYLPVGIIVAVGHGVQNPAKSQQLTYFKLMLSGFGEAEFLHLRLVPFEKHGAFQIELGRVLSVGDLGNDLAEHAPFVVLDSAFHQLFYMFYTLNCELGLELNVVVGHF